MRTGLAVFAVLLHLALPAGPALAREGAVHVVRIEGALDAETPVWLDTAAEQAKARGAPALLLRIDSEGGSWAAAARARAVLDTAELPVWAWVSGKAVGPASLLALSADELWVGPAAEIGAALPASAPQRLVTRLRREFKEAVQAPGWQGDRIDRLLTPGGGLVLSSAEAVSEGLARGTVPDVPHLLQVKGIEEAAVIARAPGWLLHVAAFLNSGLMVTLLLGLGFLGLVLEFKTAGWGLGGTVALVCLGLFGGAQWLMGGTWLPAALVFAGALLLALELLVIPGFGLTGILGSIAFLGGLFLASVGDLAFADSKALWAAGRNVSIAVLLMVGGVVALFRYLPHSRRARGLVLDAELDRSAGGGPGQVSGGDGYRRWQRGGPDESMLGARGVAVSALKPAGHARFGDVVVEVVSAAGFVPAGEEVLVVEEKERKKWVRPLPESLKEEEV